MPESRNRHKRHYHHVQQHHHVRSKPKRTVAVVLAVLAAILGLAVAYFARGADVVWMLVGVLAGSIIGYLVGSSMDKSLSKASN